MTAMMNATMERGAKTARDDCNDADHNDDNYEDNDGNDDNAFP